VCHIMLTARAALIHIASCDMISDLDRDRVLPTAGAAQSHSPYNG
jgi:hypothetical protein